MSGGCFEIVQVVSSVRVCLCLPLSQHVHVYRSNASQKSTQVLRSVVGPTHRHARSISSTPIYILSYYWSSNVAFLRSPGTKSHSSSCPEEPKNSTSSVSVSTLNRPQPRQRHRATSYISTPTQRKRNSRPKNHRKSPSSLTTSTQSTKPRASSQHVNCSCSAPRHSHHNATTTTGPKGSTTMARRLPSSPPRSRPDAQAARANDPIDENR